MPPVGFEPTISARERPQTYALDRAASEIIYSNNKAIYPGQSKYLRLFTDASKDWHTVCVTEALSVDEHVDVIVNLPSYSCCRM